MAAPTVRGVGAVGVGTSSVVAAVPTGGSAPVSGDLMVIVLESANGIPDDPSGWDQLFTRDQLDEAGIHTNLTLWAKIAGASESDVTLTGGSMANHGIARMVVVQDHGVEFPASDIAVGTGSGDATAGSGKTAASVAVTADSLILAAFGDSADVVSSQWSNGANGNLTGLTVQVDDSTNTGGGGGIYAFTGACAGTTTGASSADLTASTRDGWNSVQIGIPPFVEPSGDNEGSGTLPLGAISSRRGVPMLETNTAGLTNDGTANWGNSPDRVLWWNGYQDRWDAILPMQVPPAAGASDWWLVADVAGTLDERTLVDARSGARPTIVWDEPGKRLYILMQAISGQGSSLLFAYDYNDGTDTYTVDSSVLGEDTGVAGMSGVSNTALGRTPNGYLWAASSHNDAGIFVNRSTDDGATWGTAFLLKDTQADGKLGITYFANGGTTYVCIAGGENEASAVPGPAEYSFLYIDQNAAGWGTAGNWTDDSANIPALPAAVAADDEMCVARDANENVYFITETEDLGTATSSDPQWVVYRREPGGTWTEFMIRGYTADPSRKRPTLTIDDDNQRLYAFANTNSDTTIVYRSAPLSSLGDLETAQEYTLFSDGAKGHRNSHPPANVTAASDLLVLVDQQTDDFVSRNLLAIEAPFSGSLSLPGITASGEGDVDVEGTGAAALGAITSSGVGSPVPGNVDGSGALSLGAVTASGVGDVLVDGSGSTALGALTASGVGDTDVAGAGTGNLSPIAASGTGDVDVAGPGTANLGALTASGTATGNPEGEVTGFGELNLGSIRLGRSRGRVFNPGDGYEGFEVSYGPMGRVIGRNRRRRRFATGRGRTIP